MPFSGRRFDLVITDIEWTDSDGRIVIFSPPRITLTLFGTIQFGLTFSAPIRYWEQVVHALWYTPHEMTGSKVLTKSDLRRAKETFGKEWIE